MQTLHVRRIDLKGSNHTELHDISFPSKTDDGWYRMMISYSAFFESCKGRNKNKLYLYYLDNPYPVRPKDQYEIDRDAKLPLIKHDSLYKFFDYIGYDRKKKKILIKTEI